MLVDEGTYDFWKSMLCCLNPNCQDPINLDTDTPKPCQSCGRPLVSLLRNRFKIIKRLGRGGFGLTYLAMDKDKLDKQCVVKQLQPELSDPSLHQLIKERFLQEAITLESLGNSSSQIPNLYAYFNEGGKFYLVQEWIQGETIAEVVEKNGALKEQTVVSILSELLSVLSVVHQHGVIHRDIKPDNVILRQKDSKPVLIDFGAVKVMMRSTQVSSGQPAPSIVIGTPGFTSQEQGIGRPVFASDIYSLGFTGIYMLTGRMPHDLENDPATGTILWHQYVPQVSSHTLQVLDKSIQSHLKERYFSADDFLRDLLINTLPIDLPLNPKTSDRPISIPPTKLVSPPVKSQSGGLKWLSNRVSFSIKNLVLGGLIGIAFILGFIIRSPQEPKVTVSKRTKPSSQPPIEEPKSPKPTISSTGIQSSPSPIEPEFDPPPSSKPDPQTRTIPDLVVRTYYENLNNGQYQEAWEKLPSDLQIDPDIHPEGYTSFENWFQKITPIQVISISTVEQSLNEAVVIARYKYTLNGTKYESLKYSLVWDENFADWKIESIL